jgi:hypothetical protein
MDFQFSVVFDKTRQVVLPVKMSNGPSKDGCQQFFRYQLLCIKPLRTIE